MPDQELIAKIARGQQASLGKLYDRHAGLLHGVLVRILGDSQEAEDVLHEVFLEVWEHAADYDESRGSVRAWLVMRARSRGLDRLDVARVGEEIHVAAAARSFLHHQVRSMVGCLALVGRGQWPPDDISKALEARDRAALGFNAPPQGLYFVEAIYP